MHRDASVQVSSLKVTDLLTADSMKREAADEDERASKVEEGGEDDREGRITGGDDEQEEEEGEEDEDDESSTEGTVNFECDIERSSQHLVQRYSNEQLVCRVCGCHLFKGSASRHESVLVNGNTRWFTMIPAPGSNNNNVLKVSRVTTSGEQLQEEEGEKEEGEKEKEKRKERKRKGKNVCYHH